MVKFAQAQKKDKKYKGYSDKLTKITDDVRDEFILLLYKKQKLWKWILMHHWFNLRREKKYKPLKTSENINQSMKDVEIIEEFLYNGVDTGIWDLA